MFISLIAWGKKLSLSRLVRNRMLLRCLPEGSRESRLWDGSPWWSSGLSLYTAHLQQYDRQFARPFALLCGCQWCCFQTRRWCSRSGCSPQCRSRRIWGYWGSFQTSSAVSGRRGADVPSSALHLCEQTMWDPRWCEHLFPKQRVFFLGTVIDSVQMRAWVTPEYSLTIHWAAAS